MWKIMCFFYLKPHKHIALYQIHKIMLFLAMSFNLILFNYLNVIYFHFTYENVFAAWFT